MMTPRLLYLGNKGPSFAERIYDKKWFRGLYYGFRFRQNLNKRKIGKHIK